MLEVFRIFAAVVLGSCFVSVLLGLTMSSFCQIYHGVNDNVSELSCYWTDISRDECYAVVISLFL